MASPSTLQQSTYEVVRADLNADGFKLVGRAAKADHFGQMEVDRLRDRVQVVEDEPLDVGVRHLDRMVKLFQSFFCQVGLEVKK